jgi:endonuclease YncB( thermonuclease family)
VLRFGRREVSSQKKPQKVGWKPVAFVSLAALCGALFYPQFPANPLGVEPAAAADQSPAYNVRFELCGVQRYTCVVDGDTFWLEGEKVRIADIDTPEISEPKCDSEYQLGMRATRRLRDLLSQGPFQLERIGDRDVDRYGRSLRIAVRNGQSIGDQLVSEGLARTWSGRREPWC